MNRSFYTFLLALAGGFAGFHLGNFSTVTAANHQPILTGGGAAIPNSVVFMENATPASISASGGALTLAARGTPPQNINVTPSGTGEVRINANTATLPTAPSGTLLHLGNTDGTVTRLTMEAFANAATFQFRRYDGTAALPTAVQLSDVLGQIFWGGYGATAAANNRAQLRATANVTWTDAVQGADVSVVATPAGGLATAEVARFFGSGGFSVNSTTDPGAGVINAQSGFAKGGTAGISPTLTYLKSAGVTCTASFSGGIITVTGGVGCP